MLSKTRFTTTISFSVLILIGSSSTVGKEVPEYQLKAAFLYNFAKFTEWPASAFKSDSQPVLLGILGENPFGEALNPIKGKMVKNRKLQVKVFKEVEELESCHMLFVGASLKDQLTEVFEKVEGAVLTIGETEQFLSAGGVIRFTITDEKVGFQINTEALKKARFRLSAQLLKFGDLVTPEKRDGAD